MDDPPNRREARRYALSLPLDYGAGCGTTCDVSSRGAYFITARDLRPGDVLRCTLMTQSAQPLEFEARIVRVEKCGAKFGVAARFDALQAEWSEAPETAPDVLVH